MEIAILSDIHSNFEAFKAAIEYCEKRNIKEYIFLGDYLGEFAYVEETMKLLYEMDSKYKCTFIRGNKEDYWLDSKKYKEDFWKEQSSTTGCLYYVKNRLKSRDIEFFSKLHISQKISYDGFEDITVCHGSPFSNKEKMLPFDADTSRLVEKCDTNIIFVGHTHIQRKMEYGDTVIYNPGAIGVSCNGGAKAQFAILKDVDAKWKVEFVSVTYDIEKVVNRQIESGLALLAPYWWKVTNHLLHGSIYTLGYVMRAVKDICQKENIEFNWPDIPEEIWEKTYEQLFGNEDLMSRDVFDQKREGNYPVTLESKLIHGSKWMSLYCDRVQMPQGNIIDTYYKVKIPNESVGVVVMDEQERILLILSKRYTTSRLEWEIPAGAIDPGECAEQAAQREVYEETGCQIKELKYMNCVHPCNGLNDVLIHYYVAKVTGESSKFDSNEVGEKRWVPKEDVLKLLKNNETKSGISAHALLHALTFYL